MCDTQVFIIVSSIFNYNKSNQIIKKCADYAVIAFINENKINI